MLQGTKRDSWGSKWGFILACIGSAVGMGNIWLFPARVSAYGGATFLIPYLIFVVIIGSTGVIGEMSFGRATRSGPVHAFGEATRMRFGSDRPGKLLGLIPVLGSLALAIGYSVVTGWIFKYTFQSFTGSLSQMQGVAAFDANFGATAGGNIFWQLVGMAVTVVIMAFGIGRGIEKANKVMTPLFYLLFIGLAVYLATLPGAAEGYRYIFVLKPEGLLDPMVWVFALGQAFFSLSIAGNGTLIYGSYLGRDSDVPADAKMVALAVPPEASRGCGHHRRGRCGRWAGHRSHRVRLDGRVLHLHLPHRRPAGRGNVLLGVWKGLCAGAGQSVPKQAPGPLVLPHGQISVLWRHPAGTDLGRHQGRHWLNLIHIRPAGRPNWAARRRFMKRVPGCPAPSQTVPSPR